MRTEPVTRAVRGASGEGRRIAALLRDRQGWALVAGIALAAGLLGGTALQPVELRAQDVQFRLRPARPSRTKIVLCPIGTSTLDAWPEHSVFWGFRLRQMLENLRGAGARMIALDYIYAADVDEQLSARFRAQDDQLPLRALAVAVARGNGDVALARTDDTLPARIFEGLGDHVTHNFGLITLPLNRDAVVRKTLVYRRDGAGAAPGLPAVVALRLRGEVPQDLPALRRLAGPRDGRLAEGEVSVNYFGPPGKVFPELPAERIAAGTLTAAERELLRGAVVWIGPTFREAQDLHRGPGGYDYPGMEIHAHTLATLLDPRPLRRWPAAVEGVAAVLCALLAGSLGLLLPVWRATAITLGGLACWLGVSVLAFERDWFLPAAGPAGGALLAWVTQTVRRALQERRLRAIFGPHVGAEVLEHLSEDPRAADLGGRRVRATVLFADVRNFTPLSTTMDPLRLAQVMNDYFSRMVEVIHRHGGTVDKFIGDEIMVFWNAPIPCERHASQAVKAALAMVDALGEFNRACQVDHGISPLEIGIGINTGDVVVGNLGSRERLSYTALGPPVNLAARLQGLNKDLGSTLLLGEETYERARLEMELPGRMHHNVEVKGVTPDPNVFEVFVPPAESRPGRTRTLRKETS